MLTNKNIIDTLLIGSLVESKRYTQNFAFYKAHLAEIIDNDFAVYIIGNKAPRKSIDQAIHNQISSIANSMNIDGLIIGHMELFKKDGSLNSTDADTNIGICKLNITELKEMPDIISKSKYSFVKKDDVKQHYTEDDLLVALKELAKAVKATKEETKITKKVINNTIMLLDNL